MALKEQVLEYLHHPFPIWNAELANALAARKEAEWSQNGIPIGIGYNTSGALHRREMYSVQKALLVDADVPIFLEVQSTGLQAFNEAHGLELLSATEIDEFRALRKLQRAFGLLDSIPGVGAFLRALVRSVHVLRQDDPEVDCSYSHPNLPFSIFVSVCQEDTEVADLRVAESILHETLHLYLTLIEVIVPLVDERSSARYYSPWKQENRNARGILHGVFVFRGIWEMMGASISLFENAEIKGHVLVRKSEIVREFREMASVQLEESLSIQGNGLLGSLLPLS